MATNRKVNLMFHWRTLFSPNGDEFDTIRYILTIPTNEQTQLQRIITELCTFMDSEVDRLETQTKSWESHFDEGMQKFIEDARKEKPDMATVAESVINELCGLLDIYEFKLEKRDNKSDGSVSDDQA